MQTPARRTLGIPGQASEREPEGGSWKEKMKRTRSEKVK